MHGNNSSKKIWSKTQPATKSRKSRSTETKINCSQLKRAAPGYPLLLFLWVSVFSLCTPNSWGLQCGWATVDPVTTLCCSGLVYVRSGINPACCGNIAYDAFYSYCCNGHIRRKTNFGRCCGTRTYDARSSTCQDGAYIRPRRPDNSGSICCVRNNQRHCCSQGGGCCSSSGSGSQAIPGQNTGSSSISIPGFRPACCDIVSLAAKSQCCSTITQKAGVMPACCNTDRYRPTCCHTSVTTFVCCHATYGTPPCCRKKNDRPDYYYPYHQPPTTTTTTTQATTTTTTTVAPTYPPYIRPIQPGPEPVTDSCCNWQYPQAYCCSSLYLTNGNQVPDYGRMERKPQCCTYRYTCCIIRNYQRQSRCCSRSSSSTGPSPLCCSNRYRNNYVPTTTTTTLPPEHRCYSCKVNGGPDYNQNPPRLTYPLDHSAAHRQPSETGPDGGPGWARLSCCNSGYLIQCCRNALRLAGVYADCCSADIISDSSSSSNSYPSHSSYDSSHYNRYDYSSSQQSEEPQYRAACNGKPYDVTYYICCYGIVRRRYGTRPACCGTTLFDATSKRCCSGGQVKRTCTTSKSQHDWTNQCGK